MDSPADDSGCKLEPRLHATAFSRPKAEAITQWLIAPAKQATPYSSFYASHPARRKHHQPADTNKLESSLLQKETSRRKLREQEAITLAAVSRRKRQDLKCSSPGQPGEHTVLMLQCGLHSRRHKAATVSARKWVQALQATRKELKLPNKHSKWFQRGQRLKNLSNNCKLLVKQQTAEKVWSI